MLRVWLPLTKDLRNQGLDDVTVMNNGATYSSTGGKLGGCYNFDRTVPNYLKIDNPLTTATNGVSMSFWMKIAANGSVNDQIVHIGNGSGWNNNRFTCFVRANTSKLIFCCGDGTNSTQYNCISSALTLNQWTHVVCTYGSNVMKIYLNGVEDKSYTISFTPSFNNVAYIGVGAGPNVTEPATVSVNDVRIYDHCLSPMEVKELSKGLVLHYPLNRGGWGQENLYGYGSDLQTTLKGLNNYNNSFNIIEEDGKKCAHVSGALSTTKYLQSKLTFTPTVMEQFTFSAEVKIKNIIRGTTNPMCEFYFSGVTLDGAWRGFTVEYIKVDGQKVGATAIGFDRYLTDTAWHKVAVTAHFNYNGTSTIPALYPNIYLRDCTGDLYIRNVKLEKGPVATPWCPNSSDALATTMGLNGTTEYDCSGFCNNGTRTGTFTWTSDTPKYSVSTYMPKASLITHPRPVFGGTDQEWTCAMWVKLDNVTQGQQAMNNFNISNNIVYSTTPLLYLNDGTNDYYMYGSQAVSAGVWTHVAFVFKNSNGTRNVYINGVLKNNYGPNKTSIPRGIPDIVTVGTNLAGYISDYRIYATALSASDVKSLYQNCATIDPDGTIRGQIRS